MATTTIIETVTNDEHPAPSYDLAGNGCWNLWVNGEMDPIATAYSYADCMRLSDALLAAGYKVFTDAI